jgi:hypothetical protein
MSRCQFVVVTLIAAFFSACSAKTLDCVPNSVQVTVQCGDEKFSGGSVEVTRSSDGKSFAKSVTFACPGDDYVLRLTVADYKSGDKYSVRFTPPGDGATPFMGDFVAVASCLPVTIKLGTTADGGVDPLPGTDGGGKGGSGGGAAVMGSVENGSACTGAAECQSGFCADGVCCESDCSGSCQACNLPASPGLCRPLAKGNTPAAPKSCATSDVATCGLSGTCDGEGACAKYADGTLCEKGVCDVGGTKGRKVCQTGECKATAELTCAPFLCDPTAVQCFSECTGNTQCVPGRTCDAQKSCGKKQLGGSCQTNTECLSDKCVDGFCCNSPCNGACEACNLTGKQGECTAVAKGVNDPHAICKKEDIATCKTTGTCDGNRACAVYEANAVCKASTCTVNTFAGASKCDGAGNCVAGSTSLCAPFACAATACVQTCKADNECVGGNLCINGSCGKKAEGASCGGDGECSSTFCRDGVCCEGACSGGCRSCNAAGKAGKCTFVAAGVNDPRSVCKDAGSASCKNDGKCDGAGNCRNYPAATECVAQSCNAGNNTGSFRYECDGSGSCGKTKDPVSCAPGHCGGNACTLQCSTSQDCVAPNTCVNGFCGKKPQGQVCNTDSECQQGNCVDGVCCESTCTGACKTCNAPGKAGLCSLAGAGQSDPHRMCSASGTACGTTGFCNAGGACAFASSSTTCGAASCNATAGLFTAASLCNGSGTCVAQSQMSCPNRLSCNASSCLQTCGGDGECANGSYCKNGQCLLKAAGGNGCTLDTECSSGFCTDNICCNARCGEACKSCGTGICSDISGDDPGMCSGTKTCSGGCKLKDGQTCNDPGDCVSGTCGTYYRDFDEDLFGTLTPSKFCGRMAPSGYVLNNTDCCDKDKDANPAQSQIPRRAKTGCDTGDFDCKNGTTKYVVDFDKPDNEYRDLPVISLAECQAKTKTGGFLIQDIPDSACGTQVPEQTCVCYPNQACFLFAFYAAAQRPYLLCY